MSRHAVAAIRDWQLAGRDGDDVPMKAASLVKPVLGHLAVELVTDLDEPLGTWSGGDITVRHVLSHTTGLPNSRDGDDLVPRRPPGVHWGYSGEGFVLLQRELERRTGLKIDDVALERLFGPLDMGDTWFDAPEPGFHGSRPLYTTASDYGRFLADVLALDDERWRAQWRIDDELAWGAGWGLELSEPRYGWQWGFDEDVNNFVIGCPARGDGVVVLTDDGVEGREHYRQVVERLLPGDHASLRVEHNATWLALVS